MNKFYRAGAAVFAAALMLGTLSACSDKPGGGKDNWEYQYEAPTSEGLLSTGAKQNRYMTLPDSRVVVNPFNFESQARETTQVQYSNRATMPLNFGFCDPFKGESRGVELPNVMMMAEGKVSGDNAGVQTLWEANLSNKATWGFSGTEGKDYTAEIGDGKGAITVADGAEVAWQNAETSVTVNVDEAFLTVTIDSLSKAGGRFSIKVSDGGASDIGLTEANTPGTYTFNLKDATGWSGTKTFKVKIFSIVQGNTVTFSNVKVQSGNQVYNDAVEYSTNWRPDQLGFEASYSSGAKVEGKDFFYDEKTVVRDMVITDSEGFLLYGEYNGTASVDGSTILVDQGNFKYAVNPSVDVKPVFYSSIVEARAGGAGSETPVGTYGVWAYKLESIPEGGKLRVAFSFDTKEVADADVMAMSRKPGDDCADKLAERTKQWDDLLSRVPRPGTFEIQTVDAKGVTADDVKQSYYEAWVQFIGNVLPANPEVDFNYRSFSAGKASLWGYGSPKCSYTATWDSLYGISYYVQIDADIAWEMYRGLMSLVDETGMIAGESLPSNNARVAWMLYTVKKDKDALAEVQPELEKHLTWRFNNPRWIYMDNTPDIMQKDIDFVASALIDVEYLKKINAELGKESENEKWTGRIEKLYKNMKLWFFSDVTEYPVQYFTLKDNSRGQGNASWVTKAMHVPNIQQSEVDDMMRLFKTIYHPDKPFCGLGGIKYEPYNYTLLGLMQQGYADEARTLAEVAVRDVTMSGIHSEGYNYAGTETEPLPEGVRPSIFGAAMLIDGVWMMNGVRMDDGMPMLANYFEYDGGMENLKVDGQSFNVKKEGGTFTYGGASVGENKTLEVEADKVGYAFEGSGVHPLK